jgi:hypothetical protein
MKQNLGGHKFKDDREMEKVVTRRLTSQDATSVNRKQKNSFHVRVSTSVAVWTVRERVGQQCHSIWAVITAGGNQEHKICVL